MALTLCCLRKSREKQKEDQRTTSARNNGRKANEERRARTKFLKLCSFAFEIALRFTMIDCWRSGTARDVDYLTPPPSEYAYCSFDFVNGSGCTFR